MSRPDDGERATTIYDVARAAGVSPSTVSRAFSRPGRVSSRTAQHVHEVAERLGYRSDQVRHFATSPRTRTLGLAISDITNPFYFPIIRGAEHAAAAAGYTMLLVDAQESLETEREMLRRALPLVDGFVIASSRLSDTDLRSIAKSVPVVVLNRVVAGLPSVVPDTPRGARRAVEHLATLGHPTITYVAGPEASWADGARWRALREASLELGLRENRVGPVEPTVEGGRAAAVSVAERGDRAVLAYNDLVAMGLVAGLRELGIAVPDEVSVVGFDNIFAADLVTPALTTVAAPLSTLGDTAVRHVLALAGGAEARRGGPIVVPVRLVVRASTAAPAG
ncbi:LacI family DNA-binding transcriptional regulator [Mobilicoccus massiliensis]|uniref:LacI family DNA-binding transcriptional regulator n=1 Tax=Mobilicoccus massiliensis TaxID=1522310 RepID=UPI00058B0436|nr:LacI family DNA-binding transcriptional regulator [Mobilicoccus massiliensis]